MSRSFQQMKRPADSSDEDYSDEDNQRRRRKEYKFSQTRPEATNTPVGRATIRIQRDICNAVGVVQLMAILARYQHLGNRITFEVSGRDDFRMTIENRYMANVHTMLNDLVLYRRFIRVVASIPPPC